ncbi:MAG: hypothetical protein LBH25_07140 [Fibromonadaceae bacterium]|nr:hypothetical protein [Fibromonadaceae bacterium]
MSTLVVRKLRFGEAEHCRLQVCFVKPRPEAWKKAMRIILIAFLVFPFYAFAQDFQTESENSVPEHVPVSEPTVEPEPIPTPTPAPFPIVALPKPVVSVAQALGSTSLSKGCVEDFTNVLGKNGFSMTNFAKELPPAVAKTKLQLKSPFGKPKDGDMTSAGLTVGCIKTLPESPAEIQSLLKDISFKAGLNFVESSIPTNIETDNSGGGTFKTVMSVSLISGGLGTLIYGFMQNGEVKDSVSKGKAKAAVDAEKSRNISYGIGAGLLASGLTVVIFF